GPKALALR
ncbi:phosphotransferase enzyme family protein, partial [Vibrio parahaemolyticus EKP-021]